MAEEAVLGFLQTKEQISDSSEFSASIAVSHTELKNLIKSLKGFQIVDAQELMRESLLLTQEGKIYMVNGSPEALFFSAIPVEGISWSNLKEIGC